MKISIWTAASCAAVVVALIGQIATSAAQQQGSAGDQASIDEGKHTFAEKCSHCHGPNMVNSGTITPDLRKFPDDRARFTTTVKLGKNGRMPPWGDLLSDDQIAALWAYIASRRTP
ncbi:c-type cytochrome [Bradyrhizobium sp.]|uniref:c-type cytochrome n=1 Tax=Bradyrhizobium sp. TaxID=376 RepID=UPI003C484219